MSGLDVLKWLKDNPSCSHVPTVIFSASADESHVEEAYRLGVNSYLRKPGETSRRSLTAFSFSVLSSPRMSQSANLGLV